MSDITQEQLKALFDYKDGFLVRKTNVANTKIGDVVGTKNARDGYSRVCVNYKDYLTHRLIFLWHYGYLPKNIDHINLNRSDNNIENLREATNSQNTYNQCKSPRNTSGCKNVSWCKKTNKWLVRIAYNNRKIKQWQIDDFELAELVAYEAREKYHGKFANHG
jgi:hypothetical protein